MITWGNKQNKNISNGWNKQQRQQNRQGKHPNAVLQRVRINPGSMTHADAMVLQRAIGNRAVRRLIGGIKTPGLTLQRSDIVQRAPVVSKDPRYRGSDSHYDPIKAFLESVYSAYDYNISVTNGIHYDKTDGRAYGFSSGLIPRFYFDFKINDGLIIHYYLHVGVLPKDTDWAILLTNGNLLG